MTRDPSLPKSLRFSNVDAGVVAGFGDEWSRFDNITLPPDEKAAIFADYFEIFPWDRIAADAVGADIGCGSGRWASLVAPRVGILHCIDASSDALNVARRALSNLSNCQFHHAIANDIPLPDTSLDLAYSLGVLHHIPDTQSALDACVAKLKPGAPFLLYLYYRFDNRPGWFRALWRMSEGARWVISRLPRGPRFLMSQLVAATIYWPLARAARLAERLGVDVANWPLTFYRNKSFYVIQTDSLDRLGTRLERRFTRVEIAAMMNEAGLTDIRFNAGAPFWTAVGFKTR